MSNSLIKQFTPEVLQVFEEVLDSMKVNGENPTTDDYFRVLFEMCLSALCTNVLNYGITEKDDYKAKIYAAQYVNQQLTTVLMSYLVSMAINKDTLEDNVSRLN